MKNIYLHKIVLFAFMLFLSMGLKAQIPMSSYYLENIPQSNLLNPAMTPRANGYLAIPFANTYTSVSTDISTKDLFQNRNGVWKTPLNMAYDYKKLYKTMGKAANLDITESFAPLMLGFRGKHGYVTFGVVDKAQFNLGVPKAIFQMVEKGWPEGQTFDFSSSKLDITYYREIALGYTYRFSQRLRVGAHAKLLFGLAAVKTDIDQFDLNIGKEQWSYTLNSTIYGSFPVDSVTITEDGKVDSIYRPEIDMSTLLNTMVTNFENPGFAFDIGAVYDYGDQWTFSAALNDVGMIKWKGSLNSFTSNGDFGFGGLPLAFNEILGNSEDTTGILSEIVDSIRNSVQMEHGEESFTTTTTPKLYLGAKYNINHVIGVGFVSKSTFYKQNTKQEFGLSANFNLYHFLTAHLSYNLALKGNNSLGLGLGLRGGPLQFYFIADYVPYSFRNYSIQMEEGTEPVKIPGPANLKNLSFMMGLNLLFGANGFRDEPMIDAYSEF